MGSLQGWLQSLKASEKSAPSAPNSLAFDFAFALALVGLAFLIRFLLGLLGPQILLFAVCYPAILVASLVAGARSGFIALAACVLLFWWAFVPPVYSFALERPVDVVNIALFVVAGGSIVWIGHLYRKAMDDVRRQKERLGESERRLQIALSAGRGIGTWDWDVKNDRVFADARFAQLYGVDPAKAEAGASIAEFFTAMDPDDVTRVRESIAEALRTGGVFSEEYRLVRGDGSICWVMAEGQCTLGRDGTPLRFPGVSFDVTARRTAEQQLRDLNADLERQVMERSSERGTTWQVSPHLLSVIDMNDGRFSRVNPAWTSTLGWADTELVGAPYADFVHPDDLPASYAAFEKVRAGLAVLNFENRYRAKDGSYRWLSWVAVPELGKLYSTSRDISEDKDRALALKEAEDALRQSQKMEAVGQLTGGLAHDFNNLLTGIGGSLELLRSRVSQGRTQEVERYVSAALGAVKRAAALTHRLLAFSRRQALDPKAVNINRLITDMEELIRRTVGPSVHTEVVGAGGLWATLVDPNQLENALLNLCINARDAMPDGGRMTIETANKWLDDRGGKERDLKPGQYVSLCVTDTGTGMAPDVIEKAFDPFFTTKPLGEGTGLGLSMIYGFARQSGGQVRIYSELGKGTTVCIYLPRHDQEVGTDLSTSALPKELVSGKGQTVLVIDDEPTVRMLVTEILEESGYNAIEASDGPSGMRVLKTLPQLDLLITDVGLPGGMNGRQVADAARHERPDLKILFITGYADNAAVGNGHLDRGMHLLTKPFEIEALARKIKEILDGPF
jgi:PAS domain S-box-containing protein